MLYDLYDTENLGKLASASLPKFSVSFTGRIIVSNGDGISEF